MKGMVPAALRLALGASVVAGVLVPAGPAAAAAAAIDVTSTADDGTDCTLRDAITSANQNGDEPGCAGSGTYGDGDTINVPPGTYTLTGTAGNDDNTSGDLDVREGVNIVASAGGNATNVIVQAGTDGLVGNSPGNGVDRVFDFLDVVAEHTSSITGLTIRHGNENAGGGGGGIRNEVTLTVEDSLVSGNFTSFAGGGIRSADTMVLRRSAVVGNGAGPSGGGIANIGSLQMHSSTLSGNLVGDDGGGLHHFSGIATVMGGTIADNHAGVSFAGTPFARVDDAGSVSGGGVWESSSGDLYMQGTVVADNVSSSNVGHDCFGAIGPSGMDNIIEDPDDCSFAAGEFLVADPQLSPLATNAPGTTPTYALPSFSPAVDHFETARCTSGGGLFSGQPTDQRGVARPNGAACDSGAFELRPEDLASPASCKGRPATITGTDGNDTIPGTGANDVIAALGGNDTVNGAGKNDLVCGGDGNDKLKGGGGKDRLLGEKGNDKLKGGGGDKDKTIGGPGTDRCSGGGGEKDKAKKCETVKAVP